ncbi:ferredoxin (plasmid) [Streptomyces lunaelactis]|uniref:Ferredoxin n=1 Tax=Streptomyces lunaelactis TaxID=1535768 RepID=A0A2R4TFM1_9ACTN|nr:ferredoxin [Streptomyces lunaelactis]AVZ77903.1 ferredoxin [Streptomyces lunaelactis]NUK83437.1 ferredoxin [Streptomyces lunaelactis]NUL01722.1 ferredoxin [Streptomyces lunaelactis]
MELGIDRERCQSAGMCALTAPEVFDQDAEDGRVLLLRTRPSPGQDTAARQAADICPSGAITVIEEREGGSSAAPES